MTSAQYRMERLFEQLEAWGYPSAAIEGLRRRRLLLICLLGVLSWAILGFVLWVIWQVMAWFL